MKKKIILLVAALMIFATVVSASSLNGEYKGNPIVIVKSGGNALETDEVPGQILDGHTMVPISMLRQLGASVTWDENTYSVDVKLPPTISSLADTRVLASKFNGKVANLYKLVENSSIDIVDYTGYMSNYFTSNNQKLSNASTDESMEKSLSLIISSYNSSSNMYNSMINEYPTFNFSEIKQLLDSNFNAIEDVKNATTYLFNWNYYTKSYDNSNAQLNFNSYLSRTRSASDAAIENKYKARIGNSKFMQNIIQ